MCFLVVATLFIQSKQVIATFGDRKLCQNQIFRYIQVVMMSAPNETAKLNLLGHSLCTKSVLPSNPIAPIPNKLNQKIGSKWTYLSSLECCHLISVKLENEERKKKCEASWKEELSKGLSRAQNAVRRVSPKDCALLLAAEFSSVLFLPSSVLYQEY